MVERRTRDMPSSDEQESSGPGNESPSWGNPAVLVVLLAALITAGAVIVAQRNGGGDNEPPPPPRGEIDKPRDGALVAQTFTVKGILAGVPRDRHVWLAVQLANGVYVPKKATPTILPRDRSWTTQLSEPGTGLGPTRKFSLALLVVGGRGHEEIEDWFSRGRGGQAAPALPKISDSSRLAVVSDLGISQCTHEPIETASLEGTAQIIDLRPGDRVAPAVNPLRGSYGRLPAGTQVWVVVYSLIAERYYPQTHRDIRSGEELQARLLPDGRFRSAASFGGAPGEEYEVLAVVVDRSASRFFTQRLRRWERTGDFAGLTELPDGVVEKSCVPVTLRPR